MYQDEINKLTQDLRESTFELNDEARVDNEERIRRLENQKKRLFSEKKLRHTVICGIPCNYKNPGVAIGNHKMEEIAE